MDYYKIISISRPILARANMGLDFVSDQYGCLFSRCRKYVINSLIHGHFDIGLVIIPRTTLALDFVSGQYGGLGMITKPIWKCPCINLCLKKPYEDTKVVFRNRKWKVRKCNGQKRFNFHAYHNPNRGSTFIFIISLRGSTFIFIISLRGSTLIFIICYKRQ